MKEFKISLFKSFTLKPNSNTVDSLNTMIVDSIVSINRENIKSFVRLMGNLGYAFCPATFVDNRKDIHNFVQQQLFILDFNGGISFEEIQDRAREYNLPILFAFEVSGDTDQFRVGFLNDVSIEYLKVVEIIIEALMTIFPEADPLSKDSTNIFLDGNKLLYFNESIPTITIDSLIMNMCLYLYDRDGNTHYRRSIYSFSSLTGLDLNSNRMPNVSVTERFGNKVNEDVGNLSPLLTLYIIDNGEELPNRTKLSYRIGVKNGDKVNQSSSKDKKSKIHQPYRSTDLAAISSICKLYRKFNVGNKQLSQTELMGIASNLIQVESGKWNFLSRIESQSYLTDNMKSYSNWKFYLNYMKKTDCQPYSCNRFCPYCTQCQHSNNMLTTAKPKYHTIQKLANSKEQFSNINEAVADFKRNLDIAVKADDKRIHVINAPIAIGKSTAVLDLMEKNHQRILFCFPDNDLKNEQYEKAIARGIKAVKSPSLVEIKDKLPERFWKRIEFLYQIGRPHAVNRLIKEVIRKGKLDNQSLHILENYQKDLIQFYSSDCHAFTTHSRLLTLSSNNLKKYGAVIIDEDIILNNMIINQISIPISVLTRMLKHIDNDSDLAKKINQAAKAAQTKSLITLPSIKYDPAYDHVSMGVDTWSFCHAEKFYFMKDDKDNLSKSSHLEDSLVFLKPLDLNQNIKYIMLSATVDEAICNYCFGANRVQFYQCKKAKYTGTLNQYAKETMSRAYMDKNPGIIDEVIDFTGCTELITFKKYRGENQNQYFGKTTGIDSLRGKNLNVIGTPHHPDWIYKLFACTMGLDVPEKARMTYRTVEHKGFKFWFMSFNNELLRNIQFWMIESELEQAVGRARLLRENCTVNLFSNFPLSQAILKESSFEEE